MHMTKCNKHDNNINEKHDNKVILITILVKLG